MKSCDEMLAEGRELTDEEFRQTIKGEEPFRYQELADAAIVAGSIKIFKPCLNSMEGPCRVMFVWNGPGNYSRGDARELPMTYHEALEWMARFIKRQYEEEN